MFREAGRLYALLFLAKTRETMVNARGFVDKHSGLIQAEIIVLGDEIVKNGTVLWRNVFS